MRRPIEAEECLPRRTSGLRSRVSSEKKGFASALRNSPTTAASALWSHLRGDRLGAKFRRRAVLYGWICDFWCPASRVAVEIDYPSDAARVEEHKHRDRVLAQHAILVLRIPAERIYFGVEQVAGEIALRLRWKPHQSIRQPIELPAALSLKR